MTQISFMEAMHQLEYGKSVTIILHKDKRQVHVFPQQYGLYDVFVGQEYSDTYSSAERLLMDFDNKGDIFID